MLFDMGRQPHRVFPHQPFRQRGVAGFQRGDDRAIASLYPGAADVLAALVADPMVDPHARFLAAEILFARQPGFPAPALRPASSSAPSMPPNSS